MSISFDFHTPWYLAETNLQSPSNKGNPGPALLTKTDTVGEHLLAMIRNFRDSGQLGSGSGASSSAQAVILDPASAISGSLVQAGDPSNVQAALDSLYRQLNYRAPSVSCSLSPASLFELGNVPRTLTLSWRVTHSDPLVSVVVRQGSSSSSRALTDTAMQVTPVPVQDTSFTVEVSDGQSTARSSVSLRYLPRTYWGSSANPSLTPDLAPSLQSSELKTSASGSYQFSSPAGQYSYIILPDSVCSSEFRLNPQVKVNGFDVQLVVVSRSVPVPNQYGSSPVCSIYRLSQPGLGSFTAVIA